MALVKLSSLVEAASGKVGGVVFAGSPAGQVVREKVIPSNPRTDRQVAARNAMAAAGAAWALLSGGVRDQWYAYAAETPIQGRLGKEITVSGYDMFCRAYTLAVLGGVATPTAAPSSAGLAAAPGFTAVAQTAASANMSFTFGAGATWKSVNGAVALAHISQSQSPTRRTCQTQKRMVVLGKGNSTTPPTSPIAITNPWGTVAAGHVVYVDIEVLAADGRISSKESFTVTAP